MIKQTKQIQDFIEKVKNFTKHQSSDNVKVVKIIKRKEKQQQYECINRPF